MLLFLIVVIGVVAVLLPMLHRAFLANPLLNGLIVGVLLFGILFSFRQVWMLNAEVNWMESFRRQRQGLSVVTPPKLLAPMAAMLGKSDGPVRLSALATRSLLDGINSRLDESRDISRYLIGLLIFLGLLGTFWGLLMTVGAIGDVIGGIQVGGGDINTMFADLKRGLEAPLAGMGTAFSSSLFGLAGSLAVGFLDLQASQAQNRFYNELEEWLSSITRLGGAPAGIETDQPVPAYIQALLEQTAESLENLQRIMARGEEGRIAANRSTELLTERLATLGEQMRAEQNLMVKLAENQLELRPLFARLTDQTGFSLDETTREHIRNLDRYMVRLLEEISAGRAELVDEMRSEIKLLARTIAATQEEARR
jgi:hypothetical protein